MFFYLEKVKKKKKDLSDVKVLFNNEIQLYFFLKIMIIK